MKPEEDLTVRYRVAQIGQCSKCWEYEDRIALLETALLAADDLLCDIYVGSVSSLECPERWGRIFTQNKELGCSSEERQ